MATPQIPPKIRDIVMRMYHRNLAVKDIIFLSGLCESSVYKIIRNNRTLFQPVNETSQPYKYRRLTRI